MNNLKLLRTKNKLTQSEVAEQIGVSQQALANWEAGIREPSIDKMKMLASFFGCTIDDLIKESEVQ